MSPPGFGRLSMTRAFRVVDVFGFCGLTSATSSVTVTFWLAVAIFSVKSTVCFWPSPANTASFSWASNRSASAFTEYGPGLSCGKLNRPALSALTDRLRPLSVFLMVTLAPAMAEPVGSLTEPTTALVVSPCAQNASGDKTETASASNSGNRRVRMAWLGRIKLGLPKLLNLDLPYTKSAMARKLILVSAALLVRALYRRNPDRPCRVLQRNGPVVNIDFSES